jgi:hypothetical protein
VEYCRADDVGRRVSQLAAESSFGWLAKFVVIAIRDL